MTDLNMISSSKTCRAAGTILVRASDEGWREAVDPAPTRTDMACPGADDAFQTDGE